VSKYEMYTSYKKISNYYTNLSVLKLFC